MTEPYPRPPHLEPPAAAGAGATAPPKRTWRIRFTRRDAPRYVLILGGAALVVGGFLGGILVQKNAASAAASTAGAGAGAGFGAGQGGPGRSAGPSSSASANVITGKVTLVDGNTLYLTTSDGQVITVKLSDSTGVTAEQTGALADLSVGASVSVRGSAGADGSVTADQLTVRPSSS